MLIKKDQFLNLAEVSLRRMVRSQTVLNMAAFQINNYFWIQKNITPLKEVLLKQLQIPTEGSLGTLYSTINRLEDENFQLRDNLRELRDELKHLKKASFDGSGSFGNSQQAFDVSDCQ